MDKLAAIRVYDGQNYSDEIPVTALAENIQWDESSTLIDILGSINLTRKGNIQDQIDELNNRINQETYSKPIDGIPKTDLANSVQISLGKADTALQSYTETDPTVPAWAKQPNKPTYTAQEVGALPADSQITVEVDDTLSIQGAAADAKAVGDALDSISTSVQNIWTGRCIDRFPTTTINKTVVLDNPEDFSLVNGVTIAVKYIGNAETVSNPCLNVNGTGNIPVIAGDDSSFGNDKYYLRSWGDQGLHFFIYRALGNNPGKWYLTNVDTNMWINLINDFSILKDANVATAQDLGKVPTVKAIRGGQVAEWQYKDITVDNTLNIQGAPADAKKVGNELVQIKQDLEIQQVRAETAQALKINKPVTNPNGTQGQILQTDGQGGTSWVNKQTDEQIADAVTDWLDDHVTPGGSAIVVDDTLSIQGAAADAKKTGDELGDVKDGFNDLKSALNDQSRYVVGKENLLVGVSWTTGYSIASDGTLSQSDNFRYSDLIELPKGKYTFYGLARGINTNTRIHGYDSNGDWVKQLTYSSSGTDVTTNKFTFAVSGTVKYIRISTAIDSRYTPEFLCAGDSVIDAVNSVGNSLGQWYYSKTANNESYPDLLVYTSGEAINLYVKIIYPLNPNSVYITASNDGWSTQTQVYTGSASEFVAEIPAGYSALRINSSYGHAITGRYAAIIHTVDDYSVSQRMLNNEKAFNDFATKTLEETQTISDKLTGTNYNKFYLNANAYAGIQYINNDVFNLRKYSVEKDHVYYLKGTGVALNASLPVAAFGTAEVVDDNSYIEKILDGSTTATDYFKAYVPDRNGYIYITWVTNKTELGLYDSEPVADTVNRMEGAEANNPLKIQLFGDSITDNTWGDLHTWANLIPDYLTSASVTVVNSAIGGTKLTYANEHNGVYNLICQSDYRVLDTDADVIIILSGTNDWAGATAGTGDNIGNWDSNYYTIYGALRSIVEYISTNTSAKLIVCTPPQRYNSVDAERSTDSKGTPLNYNGNTLRKFCDVMVEVCEYYGIMCLDLNSILGWNRNNVSKFTSDGLHPNGTGDEWIAHLICNEIKRHMWQ